MSGGLSAVDRGCPAHQAPILPPASAVHALDFLELYYSVQWPCNVVITASIIAKSNQILHFLLQLKRTSWALQDVFAHLKKCECLSALSLGSSSLTCPWVLPLCFPFLLRQVKMANTAGALRRQGRSSPSGEHSHSVGRSKRS